MALLSKTREAARVMGELRKLTPALKFRLAKSEAKISLGALFESTVERYPDNTMLLFEGRQWTYAEFNAEVNKLAHLLAARGLGRGDIVALFMENRAEFILAMLAVVKVGAAASLINNSLSGAALIHCIEATAANACIVGEECAAVLSEVMPELELVQGSDYFWLADAVDQQSGKEGEAPEWAVDAKAEMEPLSTKNLPSTQEITAGEPALYVYTSGTTGLPKAAVVKHKKIVAVGQGTCALGFLTQPEDRLYLCLPIYHLTGMGPGLISFLFAGGSVYLRRSFSASSFWPEVRKYQANCFVYVGELCRYLAMQPVCEEERDNPLQKMLGNGLRPDVWDVFKNRFEVERICELYGSSEGNVSFMNFLNKEKTIGASLSKVALVAYDNENDEIIRNDRGRCIEVPVGEPGLLLAKITALSEFDGYTNADATASKIVHDVLKGGDQWFNTGDLIRQIDVGFAIGLKHFQFVDRTGDTFRWRAENVSTNEVAEVLNSHAQIDMANVYGVEVLGVEGRAGMVAFELGDDVDFDIEAFQTLVERDLPVYAQPVFIRLLRNAETTVTFKLLKGDLREHAYHRDQVADDTIYVRKPRSAAYELLDETFYRLLIEGKAGY
ncbi:MAG: citronellyl-CoA synthetase [Halieaceae bacterium]|jgi:citronellyl-CoA synthetase